MSAAFINADMLAWARERAGIDIGALAAKLSVKEEKLDAWERGESRPTFRQAQNFAHHVHVPFGYLFLNNPIKEELPIPDLRTVGSERPRKISVDLRDTIRDVLKRQQWYGDYQRDRGVEPVRAVGRRDVVSDSVSEIVTDMKELLGLTRWPSRGDWEDYFRDLVRRIESIGVLVMRNSMVGGNRFRPLRVEEFRGFSVVDKYAPAIFINTADCPEARLFTLIHELAHIWFGRSGISDTRPRRGKGVEAVCNAVAAEFLAPAEEFLGDWDNEVEWARNLPPLAAKFHVSQWVIARRALELGLIDRGEYNGFADARQKAHENRERENKRISFFQLQPSRISKRFAQAVASEALGGRILLRDASSLLGIKPHRVAEFAKKELGS